MIRPLRRAHRAAFVALGVALPVLIAAGLAARRLPEPMDAIPAALLPSVPAPAPAAIDRDDLWTGARLRTRVGPHPNDAGWRVELAPLTPVARPDVLLYWTDRQPTMQTVPDEAVLLGRFAATSAQVFRLPPDVRDGTLLLYSLAHAEVFAAARLPAAAPAADGER